MFIVRNQESTRQKRREVLRNVTHIDLSTDEVMTIDPQQPISLFQLERGSVSMIVNEEVILTLDVGVDRESPTVPGAKTIFGIDVCLF